MLKLLIPGFALIALMSAASANAQTLACENDPTLYGCAPVTMAAPVTSPVKALSFRSNPLRSANGKPVPGITIEGGVYDDDDGDDADFTPATSSAPKQSTRKDDDRDECRDDRRDRKDRDRRGRGKRGKRGGKPGHGYGDKNHDHSGPPGRDRSRGKSKRR